MAARAGVVTVALVKSGAVVGCIKRDGRGESCAMTGWIDSGGGMAVGDGGGMTVGDGSMTVGAEGVT